MLPSANPRLVIITVISLAIIGGAYFLRQNNQTFRGGTTAAEEEHKMTDVSTDRRFNKNRRSGPDLPSRSANLRQVTTGVATLALQTPAVLPPLTGYALDHFDTWTTIPVGYRADGLTVANGTITLAGNSESTDSRTGVMISPALPLKFPSLAAPSTQSIAMPEGGNVTVEISLTQDGEDWSPWAVIERFRPPDGKRVAPPMQMELSTAQIAEYDEQSSPSLSPPPGPAIRYRLTLSSSGSKAPSVADVRIWKREYQ